METRYGHTRMGYALERIREKIFEGTAHDNEYLQLLDDVHEYWDDEVADWYNTLAEKEDRPVKPRTVYLLLRPQQRMYLVHSEDRMGNVITNGPTN